jgi:hypothetical protein
MGEQSSANMVEPPRDLRGSGAVSVNFWCNGAAKTETEQIHRRLLRGSGTFATLKHGGRIY